MHAYEVRPRKDNGVDLISDVLPFGGLWYYGPDAVAKALCASGRIVGANFTIYDPERDPELRHARPFGSVHCGRSPRAREACYLTNEFEFLL